MWAMRPIQKRLDILSVVHWFSAQIIWAYDAYRDELFETCFLWTGSPTEPTDGESWAWPRNSAGGAHAMQMCVDCAHA